MKWRIAAIALIAVTLMGACGDDTASEPAAGTCETGEVTTDTGLIIEDTECGEGAEAKTGDIVTVHYTGTLENGKEFDSSRGGEPFEFQIGAGRVIQGWEQGLPGMKVGGHRSLTIPPDLAYGEAGSPPVIPRNATISFDIELLGINEAGG